MIKILIPTTPERKDQLTKALGAISASVCNQAFEVATEVSTGEGVVKPFGRLLERVGQDDLVFFLTDDMFIEPDTLQKLYDAYIREFPDLDGAVTANLCDAAFAHIKVFRQYFPLVYYHLYCDVEFFEIMKGRGKYFQVIEANIFHAHYPITSGAWIPEADKTKKNAESHRAADLKLYELRKINNFYLDEIPTPNP